MKWKNRKKCCYCRQIIHPLMLTKEHVIPVSRGGNDSQYNVHPCCQYCNTEKGALSFSEWEKQLRLRIGWLYPGPRRSRLEVALARIPFWIAFVERYEDLMRRKSIRRGRNLSVAPENQMSNPNAPLLEGE